MAGNPKKRARKRAAKGQPPRRSSSFTEEDRTLVAALVAVDATNRQIAEQLGISITGLKRHFTPELSEGRARTAANVAIKGVVGPALGGDVNAAKFYLSARAGWSEKTRTEVTGADAGPVKVDVSVSAIADLDALLAQVGERLKGAGTT